MGAELGRIWTHTQLHHRSSGHRLRKRDLCSGPTTCKPRTLRQLGRQRRYPPPSSCAAASSECGHYATAKPTARATMHLRLRIIPLLSPVNSLIGFDRYRYRFCGTWFAVLRPNKRTPKHVSRCRMDLTSSIPLSLWMGPLWHASGADRILERVRYEVTQGRREETAVQDTPNMDHACAYQERTIDSRAAAKGSRGTRTMPAPI